MAELNLGVDNHEKSVLVIDGQDNVAVALQDIGQGEMVTVRSGANKYKLFAVDDIPFGHKIALTNLQSDESVIKYGEEIGRMRQPVKAGGWIHVHNMYCNRGLK